MRKRRADKACDRVQAEQSPMRTTGGSGGKLRLTAAELMVCRKWLLFASDGSKPASPLPAKAPHGRTRRRMEILVDSRL